MLRWSDRLSWTRLRAQIVKELLSILRDPRSRLVVFAPPLLQLMIFTFAATLEVRNVEVAVHNQDTGRWSQEFIERLRNASFIATSTAETSRRSFERLARTPAASARSCTAGVSWPVRRTETHEPLWASCGTS